MTFPDRTRRPFRLDESTAMLVRTPATLDIWLRDLPDEWAAAHEGDDTWSVFDVVGHLIHGERTDWVPRARIILTEGDARPFDPFDRFAQFERSHGRTLGGLLDDFAVARRQSLQDLAALHITDADLDRTGQHPALGRVTLRELVATWVAHDLDHVSQIARVLARQYADAVGPWQAYLRVLTGQPG